MLKVLSTIKRSFQILHQQIPVVPNSGEPLKTNVRHCQCFMDTLFRGVGQKHLHSTFSSNYCRKAGINTSLAAKGSLANRLQRRTACKIQNGRQEAPKWWVGSGKVSTPRFLGVLSNFR